MEFEAKALRRSLPAEVTVQTVGIKAGRLPPSVAPGSIVIMAGLAGGLDPALQVGDVLIDRLSDIFPEELSYPRAAIHTSLEIVPTPEARAKLFQGTGARAVDMENARVREFARANGASFIGIRAISDGARDTLLPAIARLVDDAGSVKPMTLAKELLARPAFAHDLIKLRKNSTLAARNLAEAVRTLVAALERDQSSK
ncbi:MAG TPA: hypothetical protein VF669_04610 [Tepidisphaeraceae bacterium]